MNTPTVSSKHTPRFAIDTDVSKLFGNTHFREKIVQYDPAHDFYKVRYNDNDEEELDASEVADIVISAVNVFTESSHNLPTDPGGDTRPVDTQRHTNVLPPVAFPSPVEPQQRPIAPLPMNAVTKIYTEPGSLEHTPEHAAIESKFGFSYCSLLGELMYAYVTW